MSVNSPCRFDRPAQQNAAANIQPTLRKLTGQGHQLTPPDNRLIAVRDRIAGAVEWNLFDVEPLENVLADLDSNGLDV